MSGDKVGALIAFSKRMIDPPVYKFFGQCRAEFSNMGVAKVFDCFLIFCIYLRLGTYEWSYHNLCKTFDINLILMFV